MNRPNIYHNENFMVTDSDLESAVEALRTMSLDCERAAAKANSEGLFKAFKDSAASWQAVALRIESIVDSRFESNVEVNR